MVCVLPMSWSTFENNVHFLYFFFLFQCLSKFMIQLKAGFFPWFEVKAAGKNWSTLLMECPYCKIYAGFFFGSPEHEVLVVSCCDCLMSVLHCQQFSLNNFFSNAARPVFIKLPRNVPCIVLCTKWPPELKIKRTSHECFLHHPLPKLVKPFCWAEQNDCQN